MRSRSAIALIGIGMAVTAATPLTSTAAAAADPVTTCRRAIDALGKTTDKPVPGVCLWTEQNFRGEMTVLTGYWGSDTCGDLRPAAKSAVSLSNEEHLLYRFTKCQEKNFLTSIKPGQSQATFGSDAAAGSWR